MTFNKLFYIYIRIQLSISYKCSWKEILCNNSRVHKQTHTKASTSQWNHMLHERRNPRLGPPQTGRPAHRALRAAIALICNYSHAPASRSPQVAICFDTPAHCSRSRCLARRGISKPVTKRFTFLQSSSWSVTNIHLLLDIRSGGVLRDSSVICSKLRIHFLMHYRNNMCFWN